MDFSRMLWGGNAEDDNRKRVLQEYWKLYAQAYNVKPIPVRTATGIEYRYPKGAIDRFNALLPFLQQQLGASRMGAAARAGGGGSENGLLGEFANSALTGLGKWGLNKMSDGAGWAGKGGIFDKIWDWGKKGVGGLGDLLGGGDQGISPVEVEGWGGDPGTVLEPGGLPSGIGAAMPEDTMSYMPVDNIFDQVDPQFSDMADYVALTDYADFTPADVTEYTDWSWF